MCTTNELSLCWDSWGSLGSFATEGKLFRAEQSTLLAGIFVLPTVTFGGAAPRPSPAISLRGRDMERTPERKFLTKAPNCEMVDRISNQLQCDWPVNSIAYQLLLTKEMTVTAQKHLFLFHDTHDSWQSREREQFIPFLAAVEAAAHSNLNSHHSNLNSHL